MNQTAAKTGVWFFVIQRLTAIILGIATVVILVFFLLHTELETGSSCAGECGIQIAPTYQEWHAFFFSVPMQILYALSVISLVAHAWVGLWTVATDYIRAQVFGKSTKVFRMLMLSILVLILTLYLYLGFSVFR